MPTVSVVQDVRKMGRVSRKPRHSWHLRHKPFIIQPCAIAPVLPGETMKNLLFQSRAVTESIANPLIGWWLEYYWFYVRHRQLETPADFESMVLEYGYDISARYRAADVDTYHVDASSVDWTHECLKVVTNEYFRDEGETYTDHQVDGMPVAMAGMPGWLDSVTLKSDFEANVPDLPDDVANATMEDLDRLRLQWEHLRANNITAMDYEDFLRTYGVKPTQAEDNKPELLRYVREWQYPASAVDGATGATSSVVSWAVSERADKDRFFREPGFVFGCTVARPKVYFNNVKGSGSDMLIDALSWLPAVLGNEPAASLKEFAAGAGPLADSTAGYWVDVKDLFLYGDQFVNFDLTATDAGLVALPSVDMTNHKYVSSTDIDELFITTNTTNLVKQDGVVDITIAGTQKDTSPQQMVL